jgi:gluconokinase
MALPRHVVVMGVSGNGKTTTGTWLASQLDRVFIEGDDFHPPGNIAKMSSGVPLDDDDRRPWLAALAAEVVRLEAAGQESVMACSALRRRYRDWLRDAYPQFYFILLDADYDTILERMRRREHFMPPALLQSQFDTLEPLEDDEAGVVVSARAAPDQVVATALAAMEDAGTRGTGSSEAGSREAGSG